jgi:branched-chain amino acid aminotransferase
MSRERVLWLAGHLVPENDANVHVLSPTFQYGINVFERVRCYLTDSGNQLLVFRLHDHLERLFQSAKILRLMPKYTASEIQDALVNTVTANGYMEDIAVHITLFISERGSWAYRGDCEMLVVAFAMGRAHDPRVGITACVSSWERIDDRSMSPRVKSGANYLNSRMAQVEALENGFDSALLLNREGKVAEAPGSCIFIVRQGVLITPPITASILESITRDTVMNIARNDLGLTVTERDIDRTELYICDEIFLCGTTMEIVPVVSVDRLVVGHGGAGPLTMSIRERYFDIVRGKVEAYAGWVLPISGG